MLVLSRKPGESIHIGDDVVVQVVQARRGQVRLGISAPAAVHIRRSELSPNRWAEPAPGRPATDPKPPGRGRPGRRVARGSV